MRSQARPALRFLIIHMKKSINIWSFPPEWELARKLEVAAAAGFALTAAVRGSKRFRDLPVILVTAQESEHDKARGAEMGANAYLIKSAFDQRSLLATIQQLL